MSSTDPLTCKFCGNQFVGKFCSRCGKPVDTSGRVTAPADTSTGFGCGLFVLILFGIGALIYLVLALMGNNSNSNNVGGAIYFCEDRIKQSLKAPSTAIFKSDAVQANGSWTVTGYVDAENSFGAKIRNTYQCVVTIEGNTGKTQVKYLK